MDGFAHAPAWGQAYSRLREKMIEPLFLGELRRALWRAGGYRVEVLHADVDAFGYDVVIECNGLMRHLQLKTRWRDGKADAVQVNVGLAEKPGGCVVYIMVDRVTLELGPFLVLAAASGTSPLDLGTKVMRSS